jgi:hypothetical protein
VTTIALGIPHAAWVPARVESMARLRKALEVSAPAGDSCGWPAAAGRPALEYREFTDRESNWDWSERMWTWMLETGANFCLTLQDDDLVAPNFWPALRAMLEQLPGGAVLGLMSQHPACVGLLERGEHWVCTHSWAVGTGYGLWREDLAEFLEWRKANAESLRAQNVNEDQMLNTWVTASGRQTWHPNPTIVDHDTTIATNYAGNENDAYRTSAVPWTKRPGLLDAMATPDFWRVDHEPPRLAFPPFQTWDEYLRGHDAMQLVVVPADTRPLEDALTLRGTVVLAIAHTPWLAERVTSMARLREQLSSGHAYLTDQREFTDRAPNAVWSEMMWRWAAESSAEWCLFLQDDAEVAPNFWAALHAILEALPVDADVVGLQATHPACPALATEGVRLVTTTDALIGVAYVVRRAALREFLRWRATGLHPGWNEPGPRFLSEDTMLGLWCAITGRKVFHPIPTIVDHDTTIQSTYGNDAHVHRRPLVTWRDAGKYGPWDLEESDFWMGGGAQRNAHGLGPPHLGRFYPSTPDTAALHVRGFTVDQYAALKADDGAPVLVGLKYRMLAKAYKEPTYRLFLATPQRGGVSPEYVQSVLELQRLIGLDVQHEMSLDLRQEHEDLVRVRSRMLRIAYESECTHLLFADGDNAWASNVVPAMLRTGKDFVQCPYKRRDGRGYTIRPVERDRRIGRTPPEAIQPDNTIEIEHTGLGLTLISRACMKQLLENYGGGELDFLDMLDGRLYPTTALFQLIIREGVLLGEDTSFATRWRDRGGKVWLYIGDGSPIAHHGTTLFQGSIEDLGFTRARP